MKILLCGADGFLGKALHARLTRAGHEVIRGVHHSRLPADAQINYRKDTSPRIWLPRLRDIDVVINAVGIIRERKKGDFKLIHYKAPAALFKACRQANISRVIQISALGHTTTTPYLASKHAADAVLCHELPNTGIVVRPGLVFGPEGTSTKFFLGLASLPIIPLPNHCGRIQPVHLNDLTEIILKLANNPKSAQGILELPGPRPLGFLDCLNTYRQSMGLLPATHLPIPKFCMSLGARLAGHFPTSLFSRDTWIMLKNNNVGNPEPAHRILGRPMLSPEKFIPPPLAAPLAQQALSLWRRPLLLGVLAAIWLITALISAGLYPIQDSLALLSPFGITGSVALAVLAGASLLDLGMGILTLRRPGRRLWLAQLILITIYTLLIAWKMPEFLLHPFGPILKNLAVITLLLQLLAEEKAP